MAGNKDIAPERLYLSRGDGQDIYIDAFKLPQHQIDGIRFVYRQFKKRKLGVILNDPTGYGKTLQIVLFINAICPKLDKPVLILCNNGQEQNWMSHFRTWTKLFDEVSIESSDLFAKKLSVYINPMENLATFSRRDWSVVVVDSETATKEILQTDFKSDFRIWVTSVNLKDDLHKFALIYHWLHPKEKFNVKDFESNARNPKDLITKAITLDAFMEDIVMRRNDFLTPFETYKNQKSSIKVDLTPPKVTRKNKDATGTKIKRSKRNLNTDIDANNVVRITGRNNTIQEPDENVKKVNPIKVAEEKMDVETFIRDREPIGFDAFTKYLMDSESTSQDSTRSKTISLDTVIVYDNGKYPQELSTSNHLVKSIAALEYNASKDDVASREINKPFGNNSIVKDSDNLSSDFVLHYDDTEKNTATLQINENNTQVESKETKSDVNVKGIDYKMKQLEEITMKKFKGSFLDSLF